MKKVILKIAAFTFMMGVFLLGWGMEAKAYTLNYSIEPVSSYQGCGAKAGYNGKQGYINIWDPDVNNDMKTISYTVTKNGQYVASNSYTVGGYMNWCSFPITIYGTGQYSTHVTIVNTGGYDCSIDNNFYLYDITPSVSVNPSSRTVKQGTSTSFSVSLSQGTNVQYQWSRSTDGGNKFYIITGATSSTYTIPSDQVTSSLNGTYYRCRLFNDNDSGKYVFSSAAKLTVYSPPSVKSPSPKEVKEGTNATFSVTASGGNPSNYTYQWYYATSQSGTGEKISGATSSSYTITSSTRNMDGRYYYCVVSNGQYEVASNRAKLTVYSSPTVEKSPSPKEVKEGTNATFSVTASGGNPSNYTYQWYYATSQSGTGEKISGATSSSYTIAPSRYMDGRYYYCVVSNGQYEVASSRAKLTVYSSPNVEKSPSSKEVKAGPNATFSVTASGGNPSNYTYQWYYATSQGGTGEKISGATSSSYTIAPVTKYMNGRYYYCVVSNGQYEVASSRAKLTVYSPPVVESPSPKEVKEGNRAVFFVTASGGNPSNYTYQWYYATSQSGTGEKISGATLSFYTIASSAGNMDGRYYYCVVSNGQYEMESSRAKLTVYSAPAVTEPSSVSVREGESAAFSVSVSGGNPSNYTYQWHYATTESGKGTLISGETSSSYMIPSVTSDIDGRYYYCVVSNGQYEVESGRAKLTVEENKPTPNPEPKPQEITVKSYTKTYGCKPFSLKAKTNGNGRLTYKSSNAGIVSVSSKGKASVKNYGTAKITVKASETSEYEAAAKTITVKVVPRTPGTPKTSSLIRRKIRIEWKKDKTATGYEVNISLQSGFKSHTVRREYSASKSCILLGSFPSGKKYYVRMRTFKTVGKTKYYSGWSKTGKVKVL